MRPVEISNRTNIYIHEYPFSELMNPIIHKRIISNLSFNDRGTQQTAWKSDQNEFLIISNYVLKLLQEPDFRISIYGSKLVLISLWGMIYNEGDHQVIHDHLPSHWSFVYYVNTPDGSAPIVFDQCDKVIHPKSGEILIFPGHLRHYVPTNNCEGRSALVGNFYYQVETS